MEEFLLFGKPTADPWRRVCCLRRPVLLAVEFCQNQGPRPLCWHPSGDQSAAVGSSLPVHLLEEVAVWLMSSENSHGNLSSLYNQQLGVHVLVQYVTLLDITARAFQRPLALALVLPARPSAQQVVSFRNSAASLVMPLLRCNRFFVHSVLRKAQRLVEESEERNFQSYYSTSGNAQQIVHISNKLRSIVQQTRGWYGKLMDQVHHGGGPTGTANSPNGTTGLPPSLCQCTCTDVQFRHFLHLLGQKSTIQLVPLLDLAPCAGQQFPNELRLLYAKLTARKSAQGLMFCAGQPVIRSAFGANSQLEEREEEERREREGSIAGVTEMDIHSVLARSENTLRTLSYRLARCMFPLLAGEKMLILGSRQRILTGIDLLEKLNGLRVGKRPEPVQWDFRGVDRLSLGEQQLSGASCEKDASLALTAALATAAEGAPNPLLDLTVIDLNNHKVRCRPYSGVLLRPFAGHRSFPSDCAVADFVASVVTDLHQLLLLAKFISPGQLITVLGLGPADQTILYNLMAEFDLSRYGQLRARATQLRARTPLKLLKF